MTDPQLVDVFDLYRDALGIEGCERLVDTVRMATTLGSTSGVLAELVLDAHRRLSADPGDLLGRAMLDCAAVVAGRVATPSVLSGVIGVRYDGFEPGPPVPGSPSQAPPPVADSDLPPAA